MGDTPWYTDPLTWDTTEVFDYDIFLDKALRKFLRRNRLVFLKKLLPEVDFEVKHLSEVTEDDLDSAETAHLRTPYAISLSRLGDAIKEVVDATEEGSIPKKIRERERYFREKEISWLFQYDNDSIMSEDHEALLQGRKDAILSFWYKLLPPSSCKTNTGSTRKEYIASEDGDAQVSFTSMCKLLDIGSGSTGGVGLSLANRTEMLRRLLRIHILSLDASGGVDAGRYSSAYREVYKSTAMTAGGVPSVLAMKVFELGEFPEITEAHKVILKNYATQMDFGGEDLLSSSTVRDVQNVGVTTEDEAVTNAKQYLFRVKETDFKKVYLQLTGVSLGDEEETLCHNTTHLWTSTEEIMNVDVFFTRLSSKPAADSAGLSYEIEFARDIERTYNKGINVLIHVLFLCFASYTMQNDRVVGSYFQTAVAEGISRDELTGGDYFFAQSFFDTANTDDYWTFFEQKILETWYGEDESTTDGITSRFATSIRLVGGIKLRQVRQSPEHCSGFRDLIESSTDSCFPTGDPRRHTNYLPWIGTIQSPTKELQTERQLLDALIYRNKNPTCNPRSNADVDLSAKRLIRVVFFNNDDGFARIATMVFRLLAEEQLYSDVKRDSVWVEMQAYSSNLNINDFDIVINAPQSAYDTAFAGTGNQWRAHELFSGATNRWYKTAGACDLCKSLVDLSFTSHWDNFRESFPTSLQKKYGNHHFHMIGNAPPVADLKTTFQNAVVMKTEEEFTDTMAAFAASKWNTIYYTRFPHRIHASVGGTELGLGNGEYDAPEKRYIMSRLWAKDRNLYADVEQLYSHFKFNDDDVTFLMKRYAETDQELTAACDWVKGNEYTGSIWNSWMRFSVEYEMERATGTYGQYCFAPWSNEAGAERTLFLDDSSGLRKDITMPDGTTEPVPTREEYAELVRKASAGDLDAEKKARYVEPWVYRTCSEMGIQSSWSGSWLFSPGTSTSSRTQVSLQYDCAGFGKFFTLDMSRMEVFEIYNMLKDQNWIDAATRGLLVEFFLYEQNTQLYNHIQYFVEVGATGGYVVNQKHHSFKVFSLNNFDKPGAFVFTGVIMLLCAVYLIHEFISDIMDQQRDLREKSHRQSTHFHGNHCPMFDCCNCCSEDDLPVCACSDELDENRTCPNIWKAFRPLGVSYSATSFFSLFTNFDNLMRFAIWGLFICSLIFRFWYMNMEATDDPLSCLGVWPSDLEDLSYITFVITVLEGFFMIIAIMFSLHYLGYLSPGFQLLLETMRRAMRNIISVLLILLLWLIGFAITAWHVWGTVLFDFMGVYPSLRKILLMMIGDFEIVAAMRETRSHYTTVYFIFFYVVIILVLFNLLIGVIASAYISASEDSFDHETFELLATHDPFASSWNPESGFKMKAFLKDFFNANLKFYTCGCCAEKKDRFRKNPILFWRCYREILLYMDSDSLRDSIIGIVSFKELASRAEGGEEDDDEEDASYAKSETTDLVAKSVVDFLDDQLGGEERRERIFQLLVKVPATLMGSYKSRYWSLVLDHHNNWLNEVKAWKKLEHTDPYQKVEARMEEEKLKHAKKEKQLQ
eukprot:TRINITY_DN21775_c0_g1_i1.p1 TRINITY_DN21775_c0_g1~~TRINITY_DN21775_c0_g1_i1.p1  ORF type:complete len:1549 (+),score=275.69 TRINITY_DN21775_c0_g1_i1:52-4698(+)